MYVHILKLVFSVPKRTARIKVERQHAANLRKIADEISTGIMSVLDPSDKFHRPFLSMMGGARDASILNPVDVLVVAYG